MMRPMYALAVAAIMITALSPAAATAPHASKVTHPTAAPPVPPQGAGAQFDLGVWTVHASAVDANFKTGDFSTAAKILMTREGGDVSADRANGNYKTQLIYLNGNVVMHDRRGDYGGLAGTTSSQSNEPSTLTADKAQIDGAAKIYKAMGNVHFTQGDTVVTADNGTLNSGTQDLFLQGNVHIVQGARKIDANSVVYNTVTARAHAQGDVTMQFPGELHRGLATPKPLKVPKNPVTKPATPSP